MGTVWYVHVEDDTLIVTATQPAGTGTAQPVDLMDSAGTLWRLSIDSGAEALVTATLRPTTDDLVVLVPDHPYEALRLVDTSGTGWWLQIQTGTPVFLPALPAGAQDVTPAGGAWHWLRLTAVDGT